MTSSSVQDASRLRNQALGNRPRDLPPKGSGNPSLHLTVYVSDVDAHCERARAAGATILDEPQEGDRCYEAIDPEGHRWRFHQHTGRRFAFRERD